MYKLNVPVILMHTDRRFQRLYKTTKESNPAIAEILWKITFAAKSVKWWSKRDPEYATALATYYGRMSPHWKKTLDEEIAVELMKYQMSDL